MPKSVKKQPTATAWPPDELRRIAETDDLHIRPPSSLWQQLLPQRLARSHQGRRLRSRKRR